MSRPRTTLLVVLAVAGTWALGAAAASVTDEPAPREPLTDPAAEPSDVARTMHDELRALAGAWADGGGTFGYPFWEKASQRWRSREIPDSIFREYVTGYRDRLVTGCGLVRDVEATTEAAEDVQDLLVDACERRVDGLRAQQRWLDALIARGAASDDPDELAELDERIDEHETDAREALQESWRDTRIAMELAQGELDAEGLERLPEDAFV